MQWDTYEWARWYFLNLYAWQEVAVWGSVSLSGWCVAAAYVLKYRALKRVVRPRGMFRVESVR